MSEELSELNPRQSEQSEMPFALVQGTPMTAMPKDLYIPPDALEVFLETFEGPLDLLLYLIRKQNIDILDIPLVEITEQYVRYITLMEVLQLELAGEYLLMAAMLAEIKSRMLLPRRIEDETEDDPRVELIRRLQEYERYRKAAEQLDTIPRLERDLFTTMIEFSNPNKKVPEVSLDAMLKCFSEALKRVDLFSHHKIEKEALSVRERMGIVLEKVDANSFINFFDLYDVEEGRAGVIVSFLAVLQLVKDLLIQLVQNEPNGPVYIKASS